MLGFQNPVNVTAWSFHSVFCWSVFPCTRWIHQWHQSMSLRDSFVYAGAGLQGALLLPVVSLYNACECFIDICSIMCHIPVLHQGWWLVVTSLKCCVMTYSDVSAAFDTAILNYFSRWIILPDNKTQEELLRTTQLVYSNQEGKMVSLLCHPIWTSIYAPAGTEPLILSCSVGSKTSWATSAVWL